MVTCKQFMQDLNDYLDDLLDPRLKEELRRHINECPNCWVICDTTEKTLKVYRGMDAQAVPAEVQARLMEVLQKKMAENTALRQKKGEC